MRSAILAVVLLLPVPVSSLLAEPAPKREMGAMWAADGLLVFWNEPGTHFTIKLPGEKYREANLGGISVFMDEFLVQVIVVDAAHFSPPSDATNAELLRLHMEFEADHWAETVGAPMPAQIREPSRALTDDAMLWEIQWSRKARKAARRMQRGNRKDQRAVKQLFLTAVVGGRILSVAHPLMSGEDEETAYGYLENVARSLERESEPIVVEELQRQLRENSRRELGEQVAASIGAKQGVMKFDYGFMVGMPEGWELTHEQEQGDQLIVAFTLPKTWSDLEKQNIANAVSVTAYRSEGFGDIEAMIAHERGRIADIEMSWEEAEAEWGRGFVIVTKIRGLEYKSKSVIHTANGIGYVITFTATHGTYDKNVPAFERFLREVSFVKPAEAPSAE